MDDATVSPTITRRLPLFMLTSRTCPSRIRGIAPDRGKNVSIRGTAAKSRRDGSRCLVAPARYPDDPKKNFEAKRRLVSAGADQQLHAHDRYAADALRGFVDESESPAPHNGGAVCRSRACRDAAHERPSCGIPRPPTEPVLPTSLCRMRRAGPRACAGRALHRADRWARKWDRFHAAACRRPSRRPRSRRSARPRLAMRFCSSAVKLPNGQIGSPNVDVQTGRFVQDCNRFESLGAINAPHLPGHSP